MRISVPSFRSSILKWVALSTLLILFFAAQSGKAQSLGYEGPTGIFVTPLAYTAASPAKGIGNPVVAYHFLAAGPVIGDFSTVSVTEGFAKRFEIGYTGEIHAAGDSKAFSSLWGSGFTVLHGKAVLIPENLGKHNWVPSVAIGAIGRLNVENVSYFGLTTKAPEKNADFYAVATKVITQTKKLPIILNVGVRGTNASLWGLGGNAPDFTARAFGAVAFVITGPKKSSIILGSEVAQQPQRIYGFGPKFGTANLDIPTSIDYAARIVPFAKKKFNVDLGILQAAGVVAPGIDLQARARFAFGISYGF
jgi:hypothetical protein